MSNSELSDELQTSKTAQKKRSRNLRNPPAPTTLAILDRLLFQKVRIRLNGEEKELTALGAIVHQLLQKEAAGDGRASRVLLKYEELAKRGTEAPLHVEFVESDYTQKTGALVLEASRG